MGDPEWLSNISEICKQLLINESEEDSRKFLSEQHNESDDNQKKMSNKMNTVIIMEN